MWWWRWWSGVLGISSVMVTVRGRGREKEALMPVLMLIRIRMLILMWLLILPVILIHGGILIGRGIGRCMVIGIRLAWIRG